MNTQLVNPESIASRRSAAIDASVNECLVRAGGATMAVIARGHAVLIALRNHGIDDSAIAERSMHLPERMHGAKLAIDSIVGDLGVDTVAGKHAGEFDEEQFAFDVKNKLTQKLRELM